MQLELDLVFTEVTEEKKSKYNLLDFNLLFNRKKDKRKFLGRMVTPDNYQVIDSETGKVYKCNRYELRRDYKSNKTLNKLNKRKFFINFGKKRVS